MVDFSVRYCNNYLKRVAAAQKHHKKVAGGICCCCMVRQAEEMHHTSYGKDGLACNWFPVCKQCHSRVCHSKRNWIRYRGEKAVWENQNKPEFVAKLKRNYKKLCNKNK